jgi:hypothetical protein
MTTTCLDISLSEASRRLGIPISTLRDWIYRDGASLPLHTAGKEFAQIINRVGHRLYINENDLDNWRINQSSKSPPEKEYKQKIQDDIEQILSRLSREPDCELTVKLLQLAKQALNG